MVRSARALRDELLAGPEVLFFRSFPLVRVPYPSKYAFWRASKVLTPLLHILNRLIVVQFKGLNGERQTLLIGPSDVEGNKATPFFVDLAANARLLGQVGERLLAPRYNEVEDCLAECGLTPRDVDYISFDHLHTQDLRRWLGSHDREGLFPRAKLLVRRTEWDSVQGPLPPWSAWYPPDGVAGIDPGRLVYFDGAVRLGEGVVLVATPGHTLGNHSFAVHTPEGVLVTSENGVCADNYAPLHSKIAGVASYAEQSGSEVVLNGNTLEGTLDQYLSMIFERELAGPSRRDPRFFNVFPSSELISYWAFPGVAPTFRLGEVHFGNCEPTPGTTSS
ncbi:MAG: hypothetical protein JKY65_20590 [Planctomycetes bacterium]|nr:hypothetical protein [Planctomycetota bacterium]